MTAATETPADLSATLEGRTQAQGWDLKEVRNGWFAVQNGRYIRLSGNAYGLLKARASGLTATDVAKGINKRSANKQVTAEHVEASYQQLLGRLAANAGTGQAKALPWGYWIRWRLLSQDAVRALAAPLTILFRLPVAVLAITVEILSLYLFRGYFSGALPATDWLLAYGFFLCSLVVHELGHAAACLRYGVVPTDIGFTVYLTYPALYADVSPVWELPRWNRVAVDVGGCYFQLLFGCAYLVGFHFSHYQPLRMAAVGILYAIMFSLNPIFKFDGYWLLADILDVPNLSRQPSRLVSYIASRMRGRVPAARQSLPPWLLIVLAAYSVATICIWLAFIVQLWPRVMHLGQSTAAAYAAIAQSGWLTGTATGDDWFMIGRRVLGLAVLWLMIVVAIVRLCSACLPRLSCALSSIRCAWLRKGWQLHKQDVNAEKQASE